LWKPKKKKKGNSVPLTKEERMAYFGACVVLIEALLSARPAELEQKKQRKKS
jgi:hypothetical protein